MQGRMGASAEDDAEMKPVADEELMLEVRDGAGDMLGVLFDRYQKPLFHFYARLMGDRAASEDLVQEVFLRILRYRQTYRPGTPFRAWMYQIARNARVDHFRKNPRQTSLEPEMFPPVLPGNPAQQAQESEILHRALLHLPEDKREVLILSRFQELKYEEIAELLDCELGTVKTRVHRALQELRTIYRQLEQGMAPKETGPAPAAGIPPRRLGNEV